MTQNQRKYRRQRIRVEAQGSPHPILWRMSFLLVVSLLLGLYYVGLTSKKERLDKEVRKMKQDVEDVSKQIENACMQLESFKSGRYILSKAEELKLGLGRPSFPGQVKRLRMSDRNRGNSSEDGQVNESAAL